MDTKYTTDGKKVVVIGNLNSQEKIVQEIFIVNGQEIPSGENFVVKSLHDFPAKPWKETEIARIEKHIKDLEGRREEMNRQYDRDKASFDLKSKSFRERAQYAVTAEKLVTNEAFQSIIDFISGEVKYVVTESWSPEILLFDKEINQTDRRWIDGKEEFEALKLITLFGRSDGSFQFRISQYSDGSGGDKIIHPFKDFESAKNKIQELYCKKDITDDAIKAAEKYGFEIPADKLEKYKAGKRKILSENIEKKLQEVEKWKADLEKLI